MNYHEGYRISVTLFYSLTKKQNIMGTIIFILLILFSASIYVITNLLKKNEKLEDNIIAYEKYMESLNDFISKSNAKIKQLDEKGIFESDDEVGYFLKNLKSIQEQLNSFNTNGNK